MSRVLAVALGGAAGAVLRYGLSGWVARITRQSPFPYGTLSVNLVGAFLLGAIAGAATSGRFMVSPATRAMVTVGALGAFTTFSTFAYETIEALRVGDLRVAILNVAASVTLGLVACWLGLQLGQRL